MEKIFIVVSKSKLKRYKNKMKAQKEEIDKLNLELKYYKEKESRSYNNELATEIELKIYKQMYSSLRRMFLNYIYTGKMEDK